ncbi:hypothetical protein ACFQH6_10605 [Halobacteriaceae archaeon GCM10025711]
MARSPLSLDAESKRRLNRVLQAGIVVILGYGAATGNASIVVNGAFGLAITFLPALIQRDYRLSVHPGLTLWITAAVLLHAVGFLGPYNDVWWWDHVTHTLSASIVAGVGYTTTRAIDEYLDAIYFPPRFMFVFILLFTLAFGVLWEVAEFGVRIVADALGLDPVLVQYSLEDTIVDLIFDGIGALIVALFGSRELSGLTEQLTARLEQSNRFRRDPK